MKVAIRKQMKERLHFGSFFGLFAEDSRNLRENQKNSLLVAYTCLKDFKGPLTYFWGCVAKDVMVK